MGANKEEQPKITAVPQYYYKDGSVNRAIVLFGGFTLVVAIAVLVAVFS